VFTYPHEINENRRYRADIIQRAENNPELQGLLREKCRRDIIFWIDTFAWTKDPRRIPDVLPFVCYEAYQTSTIRKIEYNIDNQQDLLIDKSRDMGVSWVVLYVFLHKWLFEPGSDFRIGSRKEEYVDRPGDIDTLFEKLRFCLDKQPMWLMPVGYDWGKHATYMRLINPELGNAIIGESANANFATGGRRKAILMDEFAKWDDSISAAAWTATADASPCRIPVSTPFGAGNKFAQLAMGTKEKIEKISLHWTLHPDKSKGAYYMRGDEKAMIESSHDAFKLWKKGFAIRSPWYNAECKRRKDSDVAQELDIDYLRSGAPFFSMDALSKQVEWKELVRNFPTDPIPWGKYVRVKLVEHLHKVTHKDHSHGWLKIFEMPKQGWEYVIGVDIGEGLPKGDECFGVIRCKITRNVVAILNGLHKPDEMSEYLVMVEKFYNGALNACENNNHGYAVCQMLDDLGSNLYFTKKDESKRGIQETPKRGWSTTARSRPVMLDELEEEIRKNSFEMRDGTLIAQCRTFVCNANNGRGEADGTFLDDGIIAMAIAGRVITENPFKGSSTAMKTKQKTVVSEFKRRNKNGGFGYGRTRKSRSMSITGV